MVVLRGGEDLSLSREGPRGGGVLTQALRIASWFYIQASGVRVVSVGALVAEGAGVRRGSGGGDGDGARRDGAVDLADAPGPGRVTVAVSVTERAILLAF
jgi:hypothetical protein